MLQSPFSKLDLERLATDHPLESLDLGFKFLQQVGRLNVVIQGARLKIAGTPALWSQVILIRAI